MTLTEKPHRIDTREELDDLLAEHDVVLLDLYTEGCAMCDAIEPVVGNVARATTATVAMCNPRTDLSLVDEFDVRSVPTLLLFENGELVARMAEGFQGTETVVEFVVENSSAERVDRDSTYTE